MNCLYCNQVLMPEHINIRKDTAVCASCNSLFSIAHDYTYPGGTAFDMYTPPKGAWIRYRDDNRIIVGATTRSIFALFAIPVIILWYGGSVGRIVGEQFIKGSFGEINWIVGTHLLLSILFFVFFVSMALIGKVEIAMDKEGGNIFAGVWRIGWNKKFYWKQIDCIKEKAEKCPYSTHYNGAIIIEGKGRTYFGSLLSETRRYYIYRALKLAMYQVRSKRSLQAVYLG